MRADVCGGMCGIAAPGPAARLIHQGCTHRVQLHVPAHLQQIRVAVDQDGFEVPLKYMTYLAMPAVVGLAIHAVDVTHQQRQVGLARVDDEVIVVAH